MIFQITFYVQKKYESYLHLYTKILGSSRSYFECVLMNTTQNTIPFRIVHCINYLQLALTMESYYELSYMESSVQLLNLRDKIRGLQKEKQEIDQKLQAKLKEELELSAKNLRMLKIVNQKVGADKYSPKKHGVGPPTSKKPSTISSTVSSSAVASCSMQLFSSVVASTGPCSPVLSGGSSSSTSGTMKVPVDSLNKGKEITLAEAKSILDKCKDNRPKFDVLDDGTDDELLSVNDAVEWLEGGTANKSKQSNVTADMLESNASMAGSDDNINGT